MQAVARGFVARKRRERERAAATLQVIVSAIVRGVQARTRCEKYRESIVALQVDVPGGGVSLSLLACLFSLLSCPFRVNQICESRLCVWFVRQSLVSCLALSMWSSGKTFCDSGRGIWLSLCLVSLCISMFGRHVLWMRIKAGYLVVGRRHGGLVPSLSI